MSALLKAVPRALAAVALRLVVLLAVDALFVKVVVLPGDDGLGTGLLAFATIIALSGVWGLVDGMRGSFGRLALVWVVVAVLYSVLSTVLGAVLFPPVDWSVVLSDVRGYVAFGSCLVAVPALVAGGFAAMLQSSGTTATPPGPAGPRG